MAGWAALRGLYRDTVTMAPYSAPNSNGEATYGTAVTYQARVVGKRQMIRDGQTGIDRVSMVTVYLYGVPPETVTVLDRITLPSRFSPRTPPILAVQHEPDDRGNAYVAIYT